MKVVKKLGIHLILIASIFILYFFQANFFGSFTINGVMPNLFVIFILIVGLFGNRFMGTIYGIVLGFFLDYLFRSKIGISAISLGMVGFLATIFDRNFSKDSRMTMMFMVAGATIVYEVMVYVGNYIVFSTNLEMMAFIKILLVEIVYNVILTIIFYPLIQNFGYAMENVCKGNKILTRYF